MAKVQFSASMMCADYGHLEQEVRSLEAAGIDAFHIDIISEGISPRLAAF